MNNTPRKRRWRWILLVIVALAAVLVVRGMNMSIEVKTDTAKKQLLQLTVTGTSTGTIKSDTEVKVTAQRIGRVSAIHVVEGDKVTKGEVLAELDPEEAVLTRNQAEATLARSKAQLAELESSYEALKAETDAAIARTSSTFKDAKSRFDRYTGLFDKGFVSKDELDSARTAYETAKAEYESAQSGESRLAASNSEIAGQQAAIREANEAYGLAKLNYDYSLLKSPIDGIVTSLPVKLGETVMAGSLVAEVIATESLYVEAFVDEADVGKVKLGQEVDITMDAYPGRSLHGEVYMISPVVLGEKHETRTFEVRTRIKEDVVLKPGMSADVEVIVGREPDALAVPSQAVIERDGGHFVYEVEGSKAHLKKVKIGRYNWTLTEIVEGLTEGARIITNPDVKGLEDGARVKVEKKQ